MESIKGDNFNGLNERNWQLLLNRINGEKCTPFLGAGACYGILPLAQDIAKNWAKEHDYPMDNIDDLGSVAQFMSIVQDPGFPKDLVIQLLQKSYPKKTDSIDRVHKLVAKINSPVYITTNYDGLLARALVNQGKNPLRICCPWNSQIRANNEYLMPEGFIPTVSNPIVFHMHGIDEVPDSLVLTEDDYVDFLVCISRKNNDAIPPIIQRALAGTSLLFLGYSLRDWSFRVVFRGLIQQRENALRKLNIAVQLNEANANRKDYLDKYFGNMNVKVFWGNLEEFVSEIEKRL